MAGTAAGIGALAITATLALGVGATGAATIRAARAAGAADAAALAAADGASGAVPLGAGETACSVAAAVASASGAELIACDLDGLVATVRVEVGAGPFAAQARARAGPPP